MGKELIRGTCTPQDSQESKPKLSGSVTPLRVKIPPAGAESRRLTEMKKNRIKAQKCPPAPRSHCLCHKFCVRGGTLL